MSFQHIKKRLTVLKHTPFHPQWLIFRQEKEKMSSICNKLDGIVVDIGCASQTPKQYISNTCDYYGLDYPVTADNWYLTKPDVYGDAQKLPFKNDSIDNILLLDVLEHIPNPDECIKEIFRTLKPEAKLFIRVPFMYPIHDSPLDFQRWTIHGLKQLAENNNFSIIDTQKTGAPVESAALLTNIALTKTTLKWIEQRNPLAVLMACLIFIIPLINLCGVIFSFFDPKDSFMAYSYTMTWQKNRNT